MDCAPVRSIIPSLKLGDYLSVQAHNPCSISHFVKKKLPFIDGDSLRHTKETKILVSVFRS